MISPTGEANNPASLEGGGEKKAGKVSTEHAGMWPNAQSWCSISVGIAGLIPGFP